MKIKFPVACDRDYETILAIIVPEIFNIEYACPEAREFYYSLTEEDIKEIKDYAEQHKK